MNYDWSLAYEHVLKAEELDHSNSKVALSVSKGTLSIPLGEYTRAMQIFNSIPNNGWAMYRRGILYIMMGDLEAAKKEMSSVRELLKKNGWEETGGIDYANAVISAREGNASGVTSNLKAALSKGDFKERAINDLEFRNYSDAVQNAMK